MLEEDKERLGRKEEGRLTEELPGEDALSEPSSLDARLEQAIRAGIRSGLAEKGRRRRRTAKRWASMASVAALLLVCLLSIRVSPAFASMLRDIPGLERFVEMIESGDRGVRLAVENDYFQPLGLSDEKEQGSLTVQGILVDESRMVVFYELRNSDEKRPYELGDAWFEDETGERIDVSLGYSRGDESKEDGQNVVVGKMDVWQNSGTYRWPEKVTLNMKLHLAPEERWKDVTDTEKASLTQKGEETLYRVGFPIDPETYVNKKQEIPIKQSIKQDGQTITFEKAVISPLRVAVYLAYDRDNTKQVFDPGDIRLVDEQGQEWTSTGGQIDIDHPIIYFESHYYHRPKSLRLEGSWFRALDKDKMDVQVNLDTLEIVQAPDDRLSIKEVKKTSEGLKLTFALKGIMAEDKMNYSFLDTYYSDGSGTRFTMKGAGGYSGGTYQEQGIQEMYFILEDKAYRQPLKFKLFTYPSYLRQEYRIPLW